MNYELGRTKQFIIHNSKLIIQQSGKSECVVFGIFVLLALVLTWPAPIVAGVAIMGSGTDGWQDAWEMWWMNQAITTSAIGLPPYHFATLYAPDGATNYLHSFNPILIILTLPVQWLFGVIPAHNVASWAALFLTAFGGYLLGRDVSGSRTAGIVSGLALGFAPHQFAQLLGHLDVLSIQFFVFGTWCLYRSLHSAGRRAVVWTLWSAVCLVASALTHPYPLISSIIVMLFMGLYWSVRTRVGTPWWQPTAKAVLAVGVGLAVAGPLLFAMFQQKEGPDAPGRYEASSAEVAFFSADLAAYFLPSPFHPLWGQASSGLMSLIKGGNAEKVVFPGYIVVVLGFVGILSRSTRRKALFWWLLAVVGLLLSLGPTLHILGTDTGIQMPAALFYAIPGTSIVRVPARFSIILMLGLSVCAALGLQAIQRWLPRHSRHRHTVLAAILLLVAFELFAAPYPSARYEVEPWFESVSVSQGEYDGVLEVPFDRGDSRPLAWQIASGLPLAGGYMSRQPVYNLSSGIPPFTDFGLNRFDAPLPFERPRDTLCRPSPGETTYLDIMHLAKIRYLALHLDRLTPDDPRISMAAKLFPNPPIYQSDNLIVYENGSGSPSRDLFGAVEDTEDWMGAVEEGKFKWATGKLARIHLWSGAEREVEMRFHLKSFATERDVTISVGDKILGSGNVDQIGRAFTLNWRIPTGFSSLLVEISGQGITPASIGMNNDERPLTIQMSECRYSAK